MGKPAALKDETNKTGTYETVYLSIMALSLFLNFSSSPPCRTGLLLLVELVRLAGLEPKAEDWNDEVGLAEVEPKAKDWNDESGKDVHRKVGSGAGGSITLLGGGGERASQKRAAGVRKSPKRVV